MRGGGCGMFRGAPYCARVRPRRACSGLLALAQGTEGTGARNAARHAGPPPAAAAGSQVDKVLQRLGVEAPRLLLLGRRGREGARDRLCTGVRAAKPASAPPGAMQRCRHAPKLAELPQPTPPHPTRTCCFSKFSMMTAVNRLSMTMLTSSTNDMKKGMATQLPQLPASSSQCGGCRALNGGREDAATRAARATACSAAPHAVPSTSCPCSCQLTLTRQASYTLAQLSVVATWARGRQAARSASTPQRLSSALPALGTGRPTATGARPLRPAPRALRLPSRHRPCLLPCLHPPPPHPQQREQRPPEALKVGVRVEGAVVLDLPQQQRAWKGGRGLTGCVGQRARAASCGVLGARQAACAA